MTQSDALDILKMGQNVFLTGQPGAGKTYILNQYIHYLKSHKINVAVTASTGIAATHIGGTTIHSWSGIGINKNLSAKQIDTLTQREYLAKRLDKARVLVIDEISMLDGITLNDINTVCKALKRSTKPFGGLQIIFVGDFFQLPPISKNGQEVYFAYESDAWKEAKLVYCYLTEQHRQTDEVFFTILQQLRANNLEQDSYDELIRTTSTEFEDDLEPVRLYTHNMNVDQVNTERLNELGGKSFHYDMNLFGKSNHTERLIKSCLSPQLLELKIDAVVMCTKNNFDAGYVNGTMGKVIDIDADSRHPVILTTDGDEYIMTPTEWGFEMDGKPVASVEQIPLRLAWAITVHKSQGMSIDRAEIDLSKTFEYGQGYVALSRVRSLKGLRLLGINDMALMVNPQVLEQDHEFQKLSNAAAKRLKELEKKALRKIQDDFILKMGGVLEEHKVEENQSGPKKRTKPKVPTREITKNLLLEKKSIKIIAKERDLTEGTIIGHIEQLLEEGKISRKDIKHLKPKTKKFEKNFKIIKKAFESSEEMKLGPVRSQLKNVYSFDELRFARLFL